MINLLSLQAATPLDLYPSIAEYSKIDRSDSENVDLHSKSQIKLTIANLDQSISSHRQKYNLPT